ncbi:MAG: hypothetical protein ACFB50_17730 [Rubrobacteraceae bacterium]
MPTSDLVRWGALFTMLGGVLFLGEGAVVLVSAAMNLVSPQAVEVLFGLTWLLVAGGMAGFHAFQKEAYGLFGRIAFYAVVALLVVESLSLTSSFAGSDALWWLAVYVGPLALIAGFALYGIATLQARRLPRWCGLAFIVATPGAVLFGLVLSNLEASFIWLGLVWLILGYALWSRRRLPIGRPSRGG